MGDWVPFKEGEYEVQRAFLAAADGAAVALEDSVLTVYLDARGRRRMEGRGRVQNALVVRLLDDHDSMDLLLDLGEEFKYRMREPELKAGKLFSPGVKSFLRFIPTRPWETVPEQEFEALCAGLELLSG